MADETPAPATEEASPADAFANAAAVDAGGAAERVLNQE